MKRMMIVCAMVVTLVTPQIAHGAPRCPGGGQPDGQVRCAYAPAPPHSVCAWPARIYGRQVAVCHRAAPDVQRQGQ